MTRLNRIIITSLLIAGAALLQSTILQKIEFYNAVPDLALGILVYTAYLNGSMTGQLTGFFSGFLLDLLSLSYLGFNALIRTVIGALSGLLKGMFFLDAVLFPMLLCFGATLLKGVLVFLIHLLFPGADPPMPYYAFFEPKFWIELGMNTLSAPLLFGLLKLSEMIFSGRKKH